MCVVYSLYCWVVRAIFGVVGGWKFHASCFHVFLKCQSVCVWQFPAGVSVIQCAVTSVRSHGLAPMTREFLVFLDA